MSNKQTHLKSIKNGRVFLYSKTLASRDDMVPCNAKGEIASGHVGDAIAIDATQQRRKTKYLGNVKNGVLYPYTDILATRDDMVSIDTEEQWESMKRTGEAPEVDGSTIQPKLDKEKDPESAPALTRQPKEEYPKTPATAGQNENTEYSLPVIEGMGAREAKTVLAEWAKNKFNVEMDRRIGLPDFIKECQLLAMKAMDTAKAG